MLINGAVDWSLSVFFCHLILLSVQNTETFLPLQAVTITTTRGGTVRFISRFCGHGFRLVRYTLFVMKINYVLYSQVKTEKMGQSDI